MTAGKSWRIRAAVNIFLAATVLIPALLVACGKAPGTGTPPDSAATEVPTPPTVVSRQSLRPTTPLATTATPDFRRPAVTATVVPTPSPAPIATSSTAVAPTEPGPAPTVDLEQQIASGKRLVERNRCLECHTIDGRANFAPSLGGLFGSARDLAGGGQITADEEYIGESIKSPNAKIVAGFTVDAMPKAFFSDAELAALVEYIKTLE